ncbi:MAG TPA: hypothetical protein VF406_02395 [Thermodesulfobacteriota bacterium]
MTERTPPSDAVVRALQDLDIPEARAVELAAEVERLNGTVRAEARSLTFGDEPAAHAAVLERGAS